MYYPLIHFTPPLAGAQRSIQEYSAGGITTTITATVTSSCSSNTSTSTSSLYSCQQSNTTCSWSSCTDIPRIHLKCRRTKPINNTDMQRCIPQYNQIGSVTLMTISTSVFKIISYFIVSFN